MPRKSSAVENRVYSAGAPLNEPGGAGRMPEAASAAAIIAARMAIAPSSRFVTVSHLEKDPRR